MKRLLLILLVLGIAAPCAGQQVIVAKKKTASCTAPTDKTFNENFETATTGYDQTWTAGGTTLTPTAAPPGTPPTGSCSQSLRVQVNAADVAIYHDNGSGATTTDSYFWLYVATGLPTGGNSILIYGLSPTSSTYSNVLAKIWLQNAGGVPKLMAAGSNNSTAVTISTGTWYRVHIHVVQNNTVPDSYFSLDGTDTTKYTFSTGNYAGRYHTIGATNAGAGETADIYFDIFQYQ